MNYDALLSKSGALMRQSAIREMGAMLADARDIISFAPGYPAEDAFPWEALADLAHGILTRADGSALQYGATRGYRPLRGSIVTLMAARGIHTTDDRIVVTTGSQQGLDLVSRVLIDPGDVVLLELPSYTGAITAFRNAGATMIGIEQEADGLDLVLLDRTCASLRAEGRRVKFLYVVPNFQNPTGLLMGLDKRQRLLEWAVSRDVLILEDDPYRDLYFPDVTTEAETRPIAADDRSGVVVYLSSFSKTLAPGLRVAWVAAPPALASKFELAKQAGDLCTGALDQRLVHAACESGLLAKQLPRLRTLYQARRDAMVEALTRRTADWLTWDAPRGGFFLWARLTPPLTSAVLLPAAQQHGVIFVSGTAFYVDGSGQDHIRLCFSSPPPERISAGVDRLADALQSLRLT